MPKKYRIELKKDSIRIRINSPKKPEEGFYNIYMDVLKGFPIVLQDGDLPYIGTATLTYREYKQGDKVVNELTEIYCYGGLNVFKQVALKDGKEATLEQKISYMENIVKSMLS